MASDETEDARFDLTRSAAKLLVETGVFMVIVDEVLPIDTTCRQHALQQYTDLSKVCDLAGDFEDKFQDRFVNIPVYVVLVGLFLMYIDWALHIFFKDYSTNQSSRRSRRTNLLTLESLIEIEDLANKFLDSALNSRSNNCLIFRSPFKTADAKDEQPKRVIILKKKLRYDTPRIENVSKDVALHCARHLPIYVLKYFALVCFPIFLYVRSGHSIRDFDIGTLFRFTIYDRHDILSTSVKCHLKLHQYSNLSKSWTESSIWTPCYRPRSILYVVFFRFLLGLLIAMVSLDISKLVLSSFKVVLRKIPEQKFLKYNKNLRSSEDDEKND